MYFVREGQVGRSQARSTWTGVWTFTEGQVERFSPRAHCEMSRRDGAIVAWHEVPGKASPQESRPGGYGVIRAAVGGVLVAKYEQHSVRAEPHRLRGVFLAAVDADDAN